MFLLAHVVHLGAVGLVGYVVILATLVSVVTLALLLIVEVVVLVPSRVTVVRLATVGCGADVVLLDNLDLVDFLGCIVMVAWAG